VFLTLRIIQFDSAKATLKHGNDKPHCEGSPFSDTRDSLIALQRCCLISSSSIIMLTCLSLTLVDSVLHDYSLYSFDDSKLI
jgi:hypothetical protein